MFNNNMKKGRRKGLCEIASNIFIGYFQNKAAIWSQKYLSSYTNCLDIVPENSVFLLLTIWTDRKTNMNISCGKSHVEIYLKPCFAHGKYVILSIFCDKMCDTYDNFNVKPFGLHLKHERTSFSTWETCLTLRKVFRLSLWCNVFCVHRGENFSICEIRFSHEKHSFETFLWYNV